MLLHVGVQVSATVVQVLRDNLLGEFLGLYFLDGELTVRVAIFRHAFSGKVLKDVLSEVVDGFALLIIEVARDLPEVSIGEAVALETVKVRV